MVNHTLGVNIASARRASGRSLAQVADHLLSRSFLSMIEHDQRRPSPKMLLGIARRVDRTLTQLLSGTDASRLLPGLVRFATVLLRQEEYADAAEVLSAALAHAAPGSGPFAEISARFGYALTMIADYNLAERRLRDALAAADRSGDPELRALARTYWAAYLHMRQRLDKAETVLAEARGLLEGVRLRDRTLSGLLLMHLGQVEWKRKRPLRAVALYEEASAIFERARDVLHQAMALRLIGIGYDEAGYPERAAKPLYRAADLYGRTGNTRHRSRVLRSLGIVHKRLGDLAAARAYLREALAIAERRADDRDLAYTLPELAHVDLLDGRWKEALGHATRAASRAAKIGDVREAARSELVTAAVLAHQGHTAKAIRSFRRAIEVFESKGMTAELVEAWSRLGAVRMRRGEMKEASAALARALELRTGG